MAAYRIDSLAALARQMGFTPTEVRLSQLQAAETLLGDIDRTRAYPLDYLTFRITGYRPKHPVEGELLTGGALQHDLGQLIEDVSETLASSTADMDEPVLSIDDAVERFNVTSKTIQRWRRRGLPARRFVFPDGKKRVGFLLSRVERFIAAGDSAVVLTPTPALDLDQLVASAHRRVTAGLPASLVVWRLARRLGRSTLAVLHTLRKFDAEHPRCPVLAAAAPELSAAEIARIVKGARRGKSVRTLSRKLHRPRLVVYRAMLEHRVDRLSKRKLRYVDDPLFHGDNAEAQLLHLARGETLAAPDSIQDARVPRNLPPYLRDVYRVPLLTAPAERGLFLLLHFYKRRFEQARRRFEPQFAGRRDLATLERMLADVTNVKNQILRANLRLVVSVARKHERPGAALMDLVSEGNLTLMRAADAFDPHKGARFGTYATLALMKGFTRAVPQLQSGRSIGGLDAGLHELPDNRHARLVQCRLDTDHVQTMLARLTDAERRVLTARFGLTDSSGGRTLAEAATRLALPRDEVRKLETSALNKLRDAAIS